MIVVPLLNSTAKSIYKKIRNCKVIIMNDCIDSPPFFVCNKLNFKTEKRI